MGSFHVSASAATWVSEPPEHFAVVRLEADPNIAVGGTPWGPFAVVALEPRSPAAAAFAQHPQYTVTESTVTAEGSGLPPADPTEPVLIVGRDIHRHAFARDTVDQLRAGHDRVLVVDLGWPSDDRRYADVATFGSSLAMGRALLTFLGRPAAARNQSG